MFKGFGWFQWMVMSVFLFFLLIMVAVIMVAQLRPCVGTKGREITIVTEELQ
jgi:hypothetical protein